MASRAILSEKFWRLRRKGVLSAQRFDVHNQRLNLLDDEIQALVVYVKSLGGQNAFTPEAPKLFAQNCAACHKIGKEGGEVGPDLSLIGTARDAGYIKRYINDP